MTIAEIIRSEPLSEQIFKKHGLDYSNCTDLEFDKVCLGCAVSPETVRKELIAMQHSSKRLAEPFNHLIRRLLARHDSLKEIIQLVRHALDKSIHKHTSHHELLTIKANVEMMVEKLEVHLYKEEEVLFPEFLKLWHKLQSSSYSSPSFCLEYPVESLESEHESILAILEEIKQVMRNKMPLQPREYQNVSNALDTLETNLNDLIQLENEKLFPEALALARDLNNFLEKK